jgi:hypothetical protein
MPQTHSRKELAATTGDLQILQNRPRLPDIAQQFLQVVEQ